MRVVSLCRTEYARKSATEAVNGHAMKISADDESGSTGDVLEKQLINFQQLQYMPYHDELKLSVHPLAV